MVPGNINYSDAVDMNKDTTENSNNNHSFNNRNNSNNYRSNINNRINRNNQQNRNNHTIHQKPEKKHVVVFWDSMAKRIVPREFNRHTPAHRTFFNWFRGANTKSLSYYVEDTLLEENIDTDFIHCGTNDIDPRPNKHVFTDEKIIQNLKNIGKKCKDAGVANVVISGIIPRNENKNTRRFTINHVIKSMCDENNFIYLNNDNIPLSSLYDDGVHLMNDGIRIFANNMISTLNSLQR